MDRPIDHSPDPETQPSDPVAPSAPLPESDRIDESERESFPASDPPSWAPLHPGAPVHEDPGEPRLDTAG